MIRPLLDSMNDWGKCDKQAAASFIASHASFLNTLQEASKTLNQGLELRKPDPKWDIESVNLRQAPNVDMMVHFVELLEDWCRQTENYLDEADSVQQLTHTNSWRGVWPTATQVHTCALSRPSPLHTPAGPLQCR